MNFLDIILIGIVVVFLIRGLFRGLIQEILSLTAIILAIYLASRYQHFLIPHLELYINSTIAVNALSYTLIFFGTLIVFGLLIKVDIALLGWVDRLAGGLFGFVEGALIALILLIILHSFAPKSEWLKESTIAPRSQHLLELVSNFAPQSMKNALESKGFHFPSIQEVFDSTEESLNMETNDDQPQ